MYVRFATGFVTSLVSFFVVVTMAPKKCAEAAVLAAPAEGSSKGRRTSTAEPAPKKPRKDDVATEDTDAKKSKKDKKDKDKKEKKEKKRNKHKKEKEDSKDNGERHAKPSVLAAAAISEHRSSTLQSSMMAMSRKYPD